MFLYLEAGEVKITEEGLCLPEVQALLKTDKRNKSKPFFHKCITYMFWMYKVEGEWQNQPYKKRREKSAAMAGDDWKKFEDHNKFRAVVKAYIDDQTTISERTYEGVKKDIADTLEWLNSIPLKRKIKQSIEVEVPDKDGETKKHIVHIDIDVDNSNEKQKALKMIENLIDYEEKLRKKVLKDRQMKRTNKRKFDRRRN